MTTTIRTTERDVAWERHARVREIADPVARDLHVLTTARQILADEPDALDGDSTDAINAIYRAGATDDEDAYAALDRLHGAIYEIEGDTWGPSHEPDEVDGAGTGIAEWIEARPVAQAHDDTIALFDRAIARLRA